MGNKRSQEKLLTISECLNKTNKLSFATSPSKTIQVLSDLYKQKNYEKCVKLINTTKLDLKLVLLILEKCSEEELLHLVKMNRFKVLIIFYTKSDVDDQKRIEFILKTNPQRFLEPTLKLLPIKYIEFLLKENVKISQKYLTDTIKTNDIKVFTLLYSKYIESNNEKKINNYLLENAIVFNDRDIALFLIEKIGIKNISLESLYNLADKDMKLFLDKILKKRIELLT